MALRSLACLLLLAGSAAAALAPAASADEDVALPAGLHCDVLDCTNDTDTTYTVSGYMWCENSDADGNGGGSSEQDPFTDKVPAHSRYRLSSCTSGESPYLRRIDSVN